MTTNVNGCMKTTGRWWIEAYREGMKKLHRAWNDEYESVIEAWMAG